MLSLYNLGGDVLLGSPTMLSLYNPGGMYY